MTTYCAPARMAILAVSGSRTVPAPSRIPPDWYRFARSSITAAAPGTVNVTSKAATPPSAQASAMRAATVELSARTMATSPESTTLLTIWHLSINSKLHPSTVVGQAPGLSGPVGRPAPLAVRLIFDSSTKNEANFRRIPGGVVAQTSVGEFNPQAKACATSASVRFVRRLSAQTAAPLNPGDL
jgi:hypothetical protein